MYLHSQRNRPEKLIRGWLASHGILCDHLSHDQISKRTPVSIINIQNERNCIYHAVFCISFEKKNDDET